MKVFVTGASGFVGRAVLRQLQQAGHSVRILARQPSHPRTQKFTREFGAEIYAGDVMEGERLAEGLTDVAAVIHLVGIISETRASTYEKVHTRGTQNMVAAAQSAGVRRFVQMSALGTRANAGSRYHRSKWAAEEIVRSSGLDWTIFRPSIIYGPEDQFVNMFAKMSRYSPVLPIMGSGRSKMQPVPVGDVAKCFVGALTEPKSIGGTYDLCGPEALSFEEILDTILRVTGRKRWKPHVPMAMARAQGALLEFIFPLFGKGPPLNRDQLLMLGEDNVGNPKPADELFGVKPVSFTEGIADYLRLE